MRLSTRWDLTYKPAVDCLRVPTQACGCVRAFLAQGHGRDVLCVAVNPVAPHALASSGKDGSLRLWDLRGEALEKLEAVAKGDAAATAEGEEEEEVSSTRCIHTRLWVRHGVLQGVRVDHGGGDGRGGRGAGEGQGGGAFAGPRCSPQPATRPVIA